MATVDCLGWQATARRGSQSFFSNICVVCSLVLTCSMELTVVTIKVLQEKVWRQANRKIKVANFRADKRLDGSNL